MKPRLYVLLSIVFLLIANTCLFAQDDAYGNDDDFEPQTKEKKQSDKKINTGYVFIDGKYVEPPYKIKVKRGTLFVNGHQASSRNNINDDNRKKAIKDVGYPPDLKEDSDWSDRLIAKVDQTGMTYEFVMTQYYLKNYTPEQGYDSLINYLRNYPNVSTFEEFDKLNGGVYKVVCKNGNEYLYQIDKNTFVEKSKSLKYETEIRDRVLKTHLKIIKEVLADGSVCFFLSSLPITKHRTITNNKLFELISDQFIVEKDTSYNSSIRKHEKFIDDILLEYSRNNSFMNRINKEILDLSSITKPDENTINNKQIHNKQFDEQNYSPKISNFVAFCPIAYEYIAPILVEIDQIRGLIESQGYNFNELYYLYDETPSDDNLDNIDYHQLTELCANAGFLYVSSHGNINTLIVGTSVTYEALYYWCNADADVYITEYSPIHFPTEWDHNSTMFVAYIGSNWIYKYWSEDLQNNNAISIISACQAYYGIGDACSGGICFAYEEDTEFGNSWDNNKHLLERMNGSKKKCLYRSAIDAYNQMPLMAGFNYVANSNITLCPATKFYAPENNALVPPEVTYGFFETDTWCDATIPANEALTFSVTGDIIVDSVYWENNTNGKANRIAYEWSGTQGSVTVRVHTDKIVAYGGGGQKLDFDRKTPNGEANAYYIFRVGYGTNEVVDFNVNDYSIIANTTVDFTNTSTIENPLSYHWDFGDGHQSSEQNPSHAYTEPGVYDVSLFINTPVGMQYETKLAYISVYGSDIGSMSCSAEVNNDRTITVYADISSSYADLISEYRFAIDFGNGDIEIVEGISNSVQVTYTYNDYGIYTPEVFADMFFSSGGETFSTGCVCNSVELYNPFPCSNLEANFSISPANAYLTGINSNPTATVYFSDLTTGGTNYTWDWYFLAEPEIGYEPSGGISHECYVESWGYNGNPQSKTYNHAGIYPVMLHVTDGNGCTDDVTHYVNIAHPLQCINNLKILSSGSDQLWSSNRLIVPWQQNNEECTLSLSNTFDHLIYCMNCNCNVCGETEQCFNWYINGENVKNGILLYYPVESGHTDLTNIEIESFDWLLPYRNSISLALFGRIYNPNLTSINCYDSTNIEVLAVNCAGTMNSNQFTFSYLASNNVFIPDFSANGYMINKNSWKEFYSGQMNLNSGVNQIVNSNDVSLLACDGIILSDGFKTGSGKFIAGSASDGATLEGCYHNQNFYNVVNDNPSTDNNLEPELKITPNPVSDIFTIIVTHNVDDFLRLEIFDSNSRLIKTVYNDYSEYGIYEFQVNDFNYKPGMYFCRYSNSQQAISEKFIRTQDNDK